MIFDLTIYFIGEDEPDQAGLREKLEGMACLFGGCRLDEDTDAAQLALRVPGVVNMGDVLHSALYQTEQVDSVMVQVSK